MSIGSYPTVSRLRGGEGAGAVETRQPVLNGAEDFQIWRF